MGYAHMRDFSSLGENREGLAVGTSIATAKNTAVIDRNAFGKDELLTEVELVLSVSVTTATPTAGDIVEVTIKVQTATDSSFTTPVDLKTFVEELPTDAVAGPHTAVISLPASLIRGNRYVRFNIVAAMKAGSTGTISAATAAAALRLYPNNGVPTQVFSDLDDPTSQTSGYNKDGYSYQTIAT